jgi:hypothetical protein
MLSCKGLILSTALSVLSALSTLAHAEIKTGYFIDSPVTGLYYQTSSGLSGSTQKGAFQYKTGDVVRFFLGDSENSFLLTTVSSQEVITPSLASSQPSRSLNLTRLLLSLDSTPENREEILLLSDLLSNPEFQQKLKALDLSQLDFTTSSQLDLDITSIEEAVEHLNESQQYIQEKFASEEVLFSPLHQKLTNTIVKKRDYNGRVCLYDLRLRKHPKYSEPIGRMDYQITTDNLIEYPSRGDYFNGCNIAPSRYTEVVTTPLEKLADFHSLIDCAKKGCTHSDLNGFVVDDYDDDGDWKYRTMATSFDPETKLWMEKTQGLGRTENIHHANLTEMLFFTYPTGENRHIDYQGIWKQTTYKQQESTERCLYIADGQVKHTNSLNGECPTNIERYQTEVTQAYGDMWWVSELSPTTSIEQLNLTVRWYNPSAKITSWEYLPAGKTWDKGTLYRYEQTLSNNPDGTDRLDTHTISQFDKISGVPL